MKRLNVLSILCKKYWKALCVVCFILCVLSYGTYSFVAPGGRFADVQNDLKGIKPDEQHNYTDLDGVVVDIRDFRGKPLIINSWATWIPFSQTELPLLQTFASKYPGALTVLAINRMENPVLIKSFLQTFGIAGEVRVLVDMSDYFYKAIGGYAMPETLVYDKNGVLVRHIRGVLTESVLDEVVQPLMMR